MACTFCDDDGDADLSSEFDQTAVMELASAVARSGSSEAALALDVVFRDQPGIREWIERGRHCRSAERSPA